MRNTAITIYTPIKVDFCQLLYISISQQDLLSRIASSSLPRGVVKSYHPPRDTFYIHSLYENCF